MVTRNHRDREWFVSCVYLILYSSSVDILSSPWTELDLPFNNQPGVKNDKTCGQASWQLWTLRCGIMRQGDQARLCSVQSSLGHVKCCQVFSRSNQDDKSPCCNVWFKARQFIEQSWPGLVSNSKSWHRAEECKKRSEWDVRAGFDIQSWKLSPI